MFTILYQIKNIRVGSLREIFIFCFSGAKSRKLELFCKEPEGLLESLTGQKNKSITESETEETITIKT